MMNYLSLHRMKFSIVPYKLQSECNRSISCVIEAFYGLNPTLLYLQPPHSRIVHLKRNGFWQNRLWWMLHFIFWYWCTTIPIGWCTHHDVSNVWWNQKPMWHCCPQSFTNSGKMQFAKMAAKIFSNNTRTYGKMSCKNHYTTYIIS